VTGRPSAQLPIPRGGHAPPLEVRLEVQKQRLFDAAAEVFSRAGYAEASAEAISRRAGMSKATFYEHFSDQEECLLALFEYASAPLLEALMQASRGADRDYHERHRAGLRAILETLEARGGGPAYASPDEAFAIVGATFELVSRQLRTGHPAQMLDLLPLIERLILGLLSQPHSS